MIRLTQTFFPHKIFVYHKQRKFVIYGRSQYIKEGWLSSESSSTKGVNIVLYL